MALTFNKTILIASESPDLYTTKRLLLEAKNLKFKAQWMNPYESLIPINQKHSPINSSQGLYFFRTTGIRYDEFDILLAIHHQKSGFKITNPISVLDTFRNKDKQMLFFEQNKIPLIDTIVYRGVLNEKNWGQIKKLSPKGKFILKMNRGNQGIGVNLIESLPSLKSVLETFHAMRDQKFLIQPFVEHKKEWRVFVVRQEIIGVIERTISDSDFRGNSNRSSGKLIKKISKEIQEEILRAVQLSGLDYCGVDIMETSKGFLFLEINSVPGFEQMEELTGLNIARELITKL